MYSGTPMKMTPRAIPERNLPRKRDHTDFAVPRTAQAMRRTTVSTSSVHLRPTASIMIPAMNGPTALPSMSNEPTQDPRMSSIGINEPCAFSLGRTGDVHAKQHPHAESAKFAADQDR